MRNKKDSLAKTNNNLLKQVAEHLVEIRKQNKEDNQIKYRLVWRKYDDVLWKHLKMTDMFCMQVADNKILRRENKYLERELRNYVPEHYMFQEDNEGTKTTDADEEEKTEEDGRQLKFDFDKAFSFDDTKH